MLKAWNFTINKFPERYFDNNFSKSFRTNILENPTRQMLLKVTLVVALYLDNWNWLKWFHLYTCCREIFPFEFQQLSDIHLQMHILDPVNHFRWIFLGEQITALNEYSQLSLPEVWTSVEIWRCPELIKCFTIYK